MCERALYNYMDKGVMGLANTELPKKVKYAPRKKGADGAPKMGLAGRTYADWLALPGDLAAHRPGRLRGGVSSQSKCILTLHFVRLFFRVFILLENNDQVHVKAALDAVKPIAKAPSKTSSR